MALVLVCSDIGMTPTMVCSDIGMALTSVLLLHAYAQTWALVSNYIMGCITQFRMQSSIIPLFQGSNLNVYKVEGFLKIANQNQDKDDPISNAIFNNSTSNPHVYRVVGLLRLHREIGT